MSQIVQFCAAEAKKRHVRGLVIADRELVAGRLGQEEAIHRATIHLSAAKAEAMLWIGRGAVLEQGQMGAVKALAVGVDEGPAGLNTIRAGQPAQHMVERAVLHHEHDHMVDARILG